MAGKLRKGDHVIFVDRVGQPRDALVTAIWGSQDWDDTMAPPSINVVIVNLEQDQTDSYGQKIARETSVPHEQQQQAHGYKWRLAA